MAGGMTGRTRLLGLTSGFGDAICRSARVGTLGRALSIARKSFPELLLPTVLRIADVATDPSASTPNSAVPATSDSGSGTTTG